MDDCLNFSIQHCLNYLLNAFQSRFAHKNSCSKSCGFKTISASFDDSWPKSTIHYCILYLLTQALLCFLFELSFLFSNGSAVLSVVDLQSIRSSVCSMQ